MSVFGWPFCCRDRSGLGKSFFILNSISRYTNTGYAVGAQNQRIIGQVVMSTEAELYFINFKMPNC